MLIWCQIDHIKEVLCQGVLFIVLCELSHIKSFFYLQVISKDSGPPLKQNYPASAVMHAATSTGVYCVLTKGSGETGKLQKARSLGKERSEDIMAVVRQNGNARGNSQVDNHKERRDSFPVSGHCSNASSRNQNAAEVEESLGRLRGAARREISTSDQEALDNSEKRPKGGNLSSNLPHSSTAENSFENHCDHEDQRSLIQKQRPPLVSKASLPQWTDEQLNELFAIDYEDDDSLF
ncbi:unnamed protein product [Ilex paraguariensis]|uniref:Uncharacterized protein n=1 Tax=Ilex paraguariensis TaxID=185542 RepID=A0ABC8UNB8_9AQUA